MEDKSRPFETFHSEIQREKVVLDCERRKLADIDAKILFELQTEEGRLLLILKEKFDVKIANKIIGLQIEINRLQKRVD